MQSDLSFPEQTARNANHGRWEVPPAAIRYCHKFVNTISSCIDVDSSLSTCYSQNWSSSERPRPRLYSRYVSEYLPSITSHAFGDYFE
jgi:hypothetical protein